MDGEPIPVPIPFPIPAEADADADADAPIVALLEKLRIAVGMRGAVLLRFRECECDEKRGTLGGSAASSTIIIELTISTEFAGMAGTLPLLPPVVLVSGWLANDRFPLGIPGRGLPFATRIESRMGNFRNEAVDPDVVGATSS